MTDLNVTAEACSAKLHEHDEVANALGMTLNSVSAGQAEMSMTVRKDMLNGHSTCHGGMLFSLADTVFAHACNSTNKPTVASGCSIDFIAPAREGDVLTAIGRERSRGRVTGVYDVEVYNQDNKLLAIFRGQSYQLKGRILPEDNRTAES